MSISLGRREAWLDGIEGVSSQTREEVRKLLAAEEAAFPSDLLPSAPATPPQPPRLSPGDILLNRFEILHQLGRGGMGEVYAARDHEVSGLIAIKTVAATLVGSPQFLKQMGREIHIARRIQHPNACRVFDVHRTEIRGDALLFLTMELLEGETLQQRVASAPISAPDARRLLADLAAGLQAIHDAGIVHRDLKSGNVMLARQPDRAVILDFGLSRDLDPNLLDSISLFGADAIVGTPAFMAPEQLRGEPATARSDVYALGVILFQALTGRLPFDAQSPLAIALRKLHEPPPRLANVAPHLEKAWDRVVAACLQPSPDDRPRSASAVVDIFEGKSGGTRPISRGRAILLAASLLLPAGAALIFFNQPHIAPPEAQIKFKQAEEFARRRTRENIQAAIGEYSQALTIDPKYAAAWAGLADAYAAAAHFVYLDPQEARHKSADAASRALAIDSRLAKAHSSLAYVRSIDIQHWPEADALFRGALASYSEEPLIHVWYAAYLGRIGRHDQAIREAQAAIRLDPASLNTNLQLAVEYFRAGRMADYLNQAREVVRMQPLEQAAHLHLARALEWNRDYSAAEKELAIARLYGTPANAQSFQATLLAAEGRRPEAAAIAAQVREYWKDHPMETNVVAGIYGALDQAGEVADILEEGLAKGDSTVLAAATNPYFQNVKNHPRFQALLRRLGY
jgi:serine/threonine protein kinase